MPRSFMVRGERRHGGDDASNQPPHGGAEGFTVCSGFRVQGLGGLGV